MKSENINELIKALSKAHIEIPKIIADTQAHRNKYAPLEVIIEEIKRPLSENGLAILQSFFNEGQDTYLVTTLAHVSGQYISSSIKVIALNMAGNNAAQNLGGGITFFRRYALCAILNITADKDTDGEEKKDYQKENKQTEKKEEVKKEEIKTPEYISKDQELEIQYELNGEVEYAQKILNAFRIDKISQIPKTEYRRTLEAIKSYKAKKQSINQ